MNLYLIGYRGSGKTTIGRLVAQRLNRAHVDSDERIESLHGQTIKQIFSEFGEAQFRQWEADEIESYRPTDQLVVSLGGGAVLRQENRNWLRRTGQMVWLKGKPETLSARIHADPKTSQQRPALTDLAGLEEVRMMLGAREPVYATCADLTVDVEELSPPQIAQQIAQWWSAVDRLDSN